MRTRLFQRRALTAALSAALVATGIVGVKPVVAAPAPPRPEVEAAFSQLEGDIQAATAAEINAAYQQALLTDAKTAHQLSTQGQNCNAIQSLRAMRDQFVTPQPQGLRIAIVLRPLSVSVGGSASATLRALLGIGGMQTPSASLSTRFADEILGLQALLLGGGDTAACGGATSPAIAAPMPRLAVSGSDTNGARVHVTFPTPRFASRTGAGRTFSQMSEPGTQPQGDVGSPETPATSFRLGVPEGASAQVTVANVTGYHLTNVDLWPAQPPAAAAAQYPVPAFAMSPEAYNSASPFPGALGSNTAVRQTRDLHIVTIESSAAQYRPSTHDLFVITGMDLVTTFGGLNSHIFGSGNISGIFEQPQRENAAASLVNWLAVADAIAHIIEPPSMCGEEMLVIAPTHMMAAATKLAEGRSNAGLRTRAVNVDTIPHPFFIDAVSIRHYIAAELQRQCAMRPSYVLLMGNPAWVPTWQVSPGKRANGTGFFQDPIASDMPYTLIHQAAAFDAGARDDLEPDLAIGRLPGDDIATVNAEVDKILAYETTPPAKDSFYTTASSTSTFQACVNTDCTLNNMPVSPSDKEQWPWLLRSETAGDMIRAAHMTVSRDWSMTAGATPKRFDDGTPLPVGIAGNPGYFSGNATTIKREIDDGRFLVFHLDHGNSDSSGWSEPGYTWNDTPSLNNGSRLPVVWSIDCQSGHFDRSNTSGFAQGLMQQARGGAVGVIASSRDIPIIEGGNILLNLTLAAFPETINSIFNLRGAGAIQPVVRLGDTLNAAKGAFQLGKPNTPTTEGTVLELNAFGDPSMEMWRGKPQTFDTGNAVVTIPGDYAAHLTLAQPSAEGATVTLVAEDGDYLGRGLLHNGSVMVSSVRDLDGELGLHFVLSKAGFVPATVALPPMGPPRIDSISPQGAPISGGSVTLTGAGFLGTGYVHAGTQSVPFTVESDSVLRITIPPYTPGGNGHTTITVGTIGGISSPADYRYQPAVESLTPSQGPRSGGQTVTVHGQALSNVTRIEIGKGHGSGATPVSGVTHVDDRTVTFVMLPQSAIGTGVPDEVTVYGGSSDSSWQVLTGNDELTYLYVDDGPPLHD